MAIGCATIVHTSSQNIQIFTNPAEADVYINGNLEGKTPFRATFSRRHALTIKIAKNGYRDAELKIKRAISPWFLGNILIGGLFGCTVDLISGGAYRLYPDKLEINLEEAAGTTDAEINIPDELYDNLKEITLVNDKGEEQILISLE